MSVKHSKTGASSMDRWEACPGSVRLSEGMPSLSSRYAEEGTLAHSVAAAIIETGKTPKNVDPEMLEAVTEYVAQVRLDQKTAADQGGFVKIEVGFDLSTIHPGCFGTSDCVTYLPAQKLLRVRDYKHGAGIPVEAEGNRQLMYYALGALMVTGVPAETIELSITQPRCAHPKGSTRSWRISALELLDFAADLKAAALRTEDPRAPLVPGDHCRFCPAAAICPELGSKAQALAKQEFAAAPTATEPQHLQKLGAVLTQLPMMEAWIEQVRKFAYAEALSGKRIPGFKLVEKRATRRWTDVAAASDFIQANFSDSTSRGLYDPPSLKSVAQVEKILHEKHWPRLAPFIVKESSGNTLVPESDKRPPIQILDARNEFERLDVLS